MTPPSPTPSPADRAAGDVATHAERDTPPATARRHGPAKRHRNGLPLLVGGAGGAVLGLLAAMQFAEPPPIAGPGLRVRQGTATADAAPARVPGLLAQASPSCLASAPAEDRAVPQHDASPTPHAEAACAPGREATSPQR